MFSRFHAPSPAMAVSWLALAIALGGTAFGAAATLVKIESGTGGNIADVDRTGALSTTALPAPPRSPFNQYMYVDIDSTVTLIGPSSATAVLTSFIFGNTMDQYNGMSARIMLFNTQSTTGSCTGDVSSQVITAYYAAAGQSFQANYPNGLVLKPAVHGGSWCLQAFATLKGDPAPPYYLTEASWIGYVVKGSLSAPPSANNSVALALHPPRR